MSKDRPSDGEDGIYTPLMIGKRGVRGGLGVVDGVVRGLMDDVWMCSKCYCAILGPKERSRQGSERKFLL